MVKQQKKQSQRELTREFKESAEAAKKEIATLAKRRAVSDQAYRMPCDATLRRRQRTS